MQASTAFIVSGVSPAPCEGKDYEGGAPHKTAHSVQLFTTSALPLTQSHFYILQAVSITV